MTNGTSTKVGIGLVVFGCLLLGFLAAVVLVTIPFAGARENVISGVVLLAFAAGWALMAVLSARWTDQPQRWALVPAGLMTFVGMSLLAWPGAVVHDFFGWIWPPALLVLTVWMVIQSRRQLHSRARVLVLYPVFAVLLLSSVAAGYETFQEGQDRGAHTMPGELVDVGGHRLHIYCTGAGNPTVVLEAGLGEPSTMMAGWIAPDVAGASRVCVYDRAGRGWSEPASSALDGVAVATDLHTLLERSGEKGPYVLAGHSAGGAYVLNFANLFPDQVAGVVLLDSMHPEQRTRYPGWETFFQAFRRLSALLPSLSRMGVSRLTSMSLAAGLPPEARSEELAFLSTPRHNRSVRDEFAELPTALLQAGQLKSLGAKPLIVVTAEKDAKDGWSTLQDELAALSSNSDHRLVADATHASLVENEEYAGIAAQAIVDLVESVRNGRPLAKP